MGELRISTPCERTSDMKPSEMPEISSDEEAQTKIDFSDLLGANQAFPASPDASQQTALIDANCNKIGSEQIG